MYPLLARNGLVPLLKHILDRVLHRMIENIRQRRHHRQSQPDGTPSPDHNVLSVLQRPARVPHNLQPRNISVRHNTT